MQYSDTTTGVQARIRRLEMDAANQNHVTYVPKPSADRPKMTSDLARRVAELSNRPESNLSDHPSVSTALDGDLEVKSLSSAPTYIDGLANPLVPLSRDSQPATPTPNSVFSPPGESNQFVDGYYKTEGSARLPAALQTVDGELLLSLRFSPFPTFACTLNFEELLSVSFVSSVQYSHTV